MKNLTQKQISLIRYKLKQFLKNGIDPPITLKSYQQNVSNTLNVPQFFLFFKETFTLLDIREVRDKPDYILSLVINY
jgi:hypothetical protein